MYLIKRSTNGGLKLMIQTRVAPLRGIHKLHIVILGYLRRPISACHGSFSKRISQFNTSVTFLTSLYGF